MEIPRVQTRVRAFMGGGGGGGGGCAASQPSHKKLSDHPPMNPPTVISNPGGPCRGGRRKGEVAVMEVAVEAEVRKSRRVGRSGSNTSSWLGSY